MDVEKDGQNENTAPPEKSRENRLLILIILILALLLLLLGWQFWKQKQTNLVIEETAITKTDSVTSLTSDLINLQAQYATLKTSNQTITQELNSKKDTLTLLMQQAEKYKNDPYIIAKLKRETATLREIMKGFVVTIDSLNTLNHVLTSERNVAVESLKVEKTKSIKLTQERSQLQNLVQSGSLLGASNMKVEGIHLNFLKKETITDKAKKVQKLKISFTVTANRIAKAGSKDIYFRVITPDGKELSKTGDDASIFSFGASKGYYDAVQNFDYTNQDVTMVVYCTSQTGFIPGNYIVKLYCDGGEMGETTVALK